MPPWKIIFLSEIFFKQKHQQEGNFHPQFQKTRIDWAEQSGTPSAFWSAISLCRQKYCM